MDFKVNTQIHVRFADIDAMGHVNHAKFFTYMEQARVAYFKKVPELDFSDHMGQPKNSVILASIQCDFLSPAFLDEVLNVGIRISRLGRSSIEMEYLIRTKDGSREVAKGKSTLVYFDYDSQKTQAIPQGLKDQFEAIEGKI